MSGDRLSTSALLPAIFGQSSKLNHVTRHSPEGHIVAQRMHGYALAEVCLFCGGMDGAVQLPRAERVHRIEARKQPAAFEHATLRMGHAPPDTQTLEQDRREHRVSVAPQVLDGGCVGRAPEESGELTDHPDIAGLRLRCELAHAHVVDHVLAQRTDILAGVSHGSAPVEERGGLPRTQHGNRVGFLSPATRAQPEPHYRASGFVLWVSWVSQPCYKN